MLTQVADGVSVHRSSFLQSNGTVVQGPTGVLLVDPGVLGDELECLADDLDGSGTAVAAGFSTHPHWDHLLWHQRLGAVPRHGTQRCAAVVRERLPDAETTARVATAVMPSDITGRVPLALLGDITALPQGAPAVPWDGPRVRIVEHRAHAAGHAALLVEGSGVLVAGDMLSDLLLPVLDASAADPVGDHLAALAMLDGLADQVAVVVPGHGSVGGNEEFRARVARDRAYVEALRDGREPDDPRLDPSAPGGGDWVRDLHVRQRDHLASRAGG